MKKTKEFYRGCIIGGAIGDALGWPVEFMSLQDIREKYGREGIKDLILGRRGKAEITDDTQMTLFTAEGLLRAESRGWNKGRCEVVSCVYNSYLRWLYTQGYPIDEENKAIYDGYLIKQKELYVRRAPGTTCILSLSSGDYGTIEEPINDSKGCGGIMRVAPVGLFYRRKLAYVKGADCAAITHGHPLGYISAGAFANLISCIMEGMDIEDGVKDTIKLLESIPNSIELIKLLKEAVILSKSRKSVELAIKDLGKGFLAEEALAIGVYCALKYSKDFTKAILAAVNHDGDSDSTGAITGNILGAYLGVRSIPIQWIKKIELGDVIRQVADDLFTGYKDDEEWWTKYPAY